MKRFLVVSVVSLAILLPFLIVSARADVPASDAASRITDAKKCFWAEFRKWKGSQSVMPPDDDEIADKVADINKECGSSVAIARTQPQPTAPPIGDTAASAPVASEAPSQTGAIIVSLAILYGVVALALMPLWWPIVRLGILPFALASARQVRAVAIAFYIIGVAIAGACVYVALVLKPASGVILVPPVLLAWGAQLTAIFSDPFMVGKGRDQPS